MAHVTGEAEWVLNVDVSDSPNKEEYEDLMKQHHDLILTVAEILIGYATERNRRALLFFSLMINKAVEAACDALERADQEANDNEQI